MARYAEFYDFPGHFVEDFFYLLQRLDTVNIKKIQEDMKAEQEKALKKAKKGR